MARMTPYDEPLQATARGRWVGRAGMVGSGFAILANLTLWGWADRPWWRWFILILWVVLLLAHFRMYALTTARHDRLLLDQARWRLEHE
jgi:hypothetical protein